MFDAWEKAQWEKIQASRYMIIDALSRADDGMTEDRFQRDLWLYAIGQVQRAKDEIDMLLVLMGKIRCHRLDVNDNQTETR